MRSSLRYRFRDDVRTALAHPCGNPAEVTEADLAPLPPVVRNYLRRAGVVGKPRVCNLRLEFRAEMRASPDAPWMSARALQYSFFAPRARFFFMHARRSVVPFDVFHRYADDSATMEVRVAGLFPVVRLSGDEMTKSETVTMLNDICVFAPAALVTPGLSWEDVGGGQVRVGFENAGHHVSAVLSFDAAGELVDFTSDDRSMAEGDHMRRLPWRTPLGAYHDFDGFRLASRGDACWIDAGRTWTYGRFTLRRIAYNVTLAEAP